MAKNLNKSRILNSWIIAAVTMGLLVLTSPISSNEDALHVSIDTLGLMLVTICALGRVYSSAFLGGYKNQKLITQGPFSAVRNPLYLFSLIGVTGLALTTVHPAAMFFVTPSFFILYHFLIKREEAFLKQQFGKEYEDYMKKVPRLIPSFKNTTTPEVIEVKPEFIKNAVIDAIWWFIGFWILESLEVFF